MRCHAYHWNDVEKMHRQAPSQPRPSALGLKSHSETDSNLQLVTLNYDQAANLKPVTSQSVRWGQFGKNL